MSQFKKLVRFEADGAAHYGELLEARDNEYFVQGLEGSPFEQLVPTDRKYTVNKARPHTSPTG
jgi:hypothetical protein